MRPDAVVVLGDTVACEQAGSRFIPPLSSASATRLCQAFLNDALDVGRRADADVWCAVDGMQGELNGFIAPDVTVLRRSAPSFGERLSEVIDHVFSAGYRRVVVLAGDCPTLDERYVKTAFDALLENDAVIGPAPDGGYLLAGLTKRIPRLFLEIDMGTPNVLRQTLLRARELDLRMGVLPIRRGLVDFNDVLAAIDGGELQHAQHTCRALSTVSA